jgi:uncharacterized protein (TIGR00251 family)
MISLAVKIIPRSSENKIVGFMGEGILKIKLTAPPVENQANEELILFLAKKLAIPKRNISIKSGQTSKLKQLLIDDLKQKDLDDKLNEIISRP